MLSDGALRSEAAAAPGRPHAETLLPALEAALSLAGVRPEEIEAFAVSIGPGSFTGLRVGLATVKGLAFGTGRPVAPVSTLAATACAAAGWPDPVAALLDARRGEVYAAAYGPPLGGGKAPGTRDAGAAVPWEASTGLERPVLIREGVYTPEEIAERLPRPCLLVGDGAGLHAGTLRKRLGRSARLLPGEAGRPRALHIGILGARMLAAGRGVAAEDVVPRYVRRAEAEVRRTGRRVEGPPDPPQGAPAPPAPLSKRRPDR